jgi:flagellar basal body L-ring protein FlgH
MPSEGGDGSSDQWVSPAQASAAQRNTLRGSEMYSENPNLAPGPQRGYKNGFRATRADFIDDHPSEGSLWSSSGQTNYYLTKNKVRAVGDILTINIEDGLLKDIATEVRRGLDPNERDMELAVAQEKLRRKANGLPEEDKPGANGQPAPTTARAPASTTPGKDGKESQEVAPPEEIPVPLASNNDINVLPALEVKAGEPMMAEIVERYPNGNYKIRGIKRVLYKNGAPRLVSLVGIAKSSDVSEEDVLNSGKLYEYRLEAHR